MKSISIVLLLPILVYPEYFSNIYNPHFLYSAETITIPLEKYIGKPKHVVITTKTNNIQQKNDSPIVTINHVFYDSFGNPSIIKTSSINCSLYTSAILKYDYNHRLIEHKLFLKSGEVKQRDVLSYNEVGDITKHLTFLATSKQADEMTIFNYSNNKLSAIIFYPYATEQRLKKVVKITYDLAGKRSYDSILNFSNSYELGAKYQYDSTSKTVYTYSGDKIINKSTYNSQKNSKEFLVFGKNDSIAYNELITFNNSGDTTTWFVSTTNTISSPCLYEYDYSLPDTNGNWTLKTIKVKNSTISTTTRQVEYYR